MLVKCFLKLLILWRTKPLQSLFLLETPEFYLYEDHDLYDSYLLLVIPQKYI